MLFVSKVSRRGGRASNEDAVGSRRENGILCVVVADGLGGHRGGRIASELTVETVLDAFSENPSFSAEAVKNYIDAANKAVTDRADAEEQYGQMSSTVVILLVKGKKAVWGNAGDSRLYRFRRNRIEEVTEDHSIAFMDFLCGDIEYDDIRRSPNQNKLTSALGISSGEINISAVTPIDNETAFLLCTDGWWEYVDEDDMEDTLADSDSARSWVSAMLEIREREAPEISDNFTAAAVII